MDSIVCLLGDMNRKHVLGFVKTKRKRQREKRQKKREGNTKNWHRENKKVHFASKVFRLVSLISVLSFNLAYNLKNKRKQKKKIE